MLISSHHNNRLASLSPKAANFRTATRMSHRSFSSPRSQPRPSLPLQINNGVVSPSPKATDLKTAPQMTNRSYSSPHSQHRPSPPSQGYPKPKRVSSREGKNSVKRNISKDINRKISTTSGTKNNLNSFKPIHPSPLRQVTTYHDLQGKRGPSHHRSHPSFQEILYEVILDGETPNPIIGSYEYKEPHISGHTRSSVDNASPVKTSATLSGAKVTSRNIINSTLLDGPYRQTQSKISQLASFDTKAKTLGLSEENFFRGSRHSSQTISNPEKQKFQTKSSSKSVNESYVSLPKKKLPTRSNTSIIKDHKRIPLARPGSQSNRQLYSDNLDSLNTDPSASDSDDDFYDYDLRHQNRSYVNQFKNVAKSIVNSALSSNMKKTASMPSKNDKFVSNIKDPVSLHSYEIVKSASSSVKQGKDKSMPSTEKDPRLHKKTLDKRVGSKASFESQSKIISNSPKSKSKKGYPETSYTRLPRASSKDSQRLETIDAQLGYNHLTKVARLVYFENGIPPRKTLLPKGHLISPNQLTIHENLTKDPLKTFSNTSTKMRTSVSSIKLSSNRPSIPMKSPARRLKSVIVSNQTPKLDDSSLNHKLSCSVVSKSTITNDLDENSLETKMDIQTFLSQSNYNKMRKLSLKEALVTSVAEQNEKSCSVEVVPAYHPDKLRPVVSAFDKKVRMFFGSVIPLDCSTNSGRRNSVTQPYCLGPRTSLSVIGSMGCTVLSGNLFKLGRNLQWQKREFRTDGFSLVCLSKELIKLPSGSLYMDQPDYLNVDRRSYFQPTCPPTPHITHPLVATPSDEDASKMGYYQTPKWVIPIGDIIKLNMLTRKGVRVPDSFVIHTHARNYIVKAENSRELAGWLYTLQRMIISFKDSRDLFSGLIPDSLSRFASSKSPLNHLKDVEPLPNKCPPESNTLHPTLSSQEASMFMEPSSDLQPVCRHPGKDRRPSSLFNRYDPSQPNNPKIPLSFQLQREIVHDWVNSLYTLKQIQ